MTGFCQTFRRSIFALCATAFIAGAGLGITNEAQASEVKLKAASFIPLHTAFGRPFQAFIDHVNETGKGQVQISVVGPEAIPGAEQPNALRNGLVDIIATPPSMYKSVIPEALVQDLSNKTLEELRADGAYDALNKRLNARLNSFALTSYANEVPFYLYLTKDNVETIDDLKGLRIRSQPNYAPFLRAVGANPTMISIPETYTALERGVVDGLGYPGWSIEDLGWEKMLKVRIEPGFYTVVINVLMNDKRFEGLSDEQRQVLSDAVAWFDDYMITYNDETTAKSIEAQDAAGIKVVDLGPEYLELAREALWQDLLKNSPEGAQELEPLFVK